MRYRMPPVLKINCGRSINQITTAKMFMMLRMRT